MEWPQHSLDKMQGLHPDLIKVLNDFIKTSPYEVIVAQGARTREYQYSLWLSCFNPDGTRKPNGVWRTNCNGTPKGQMTPEGSHGTGVSNHQGGHAVDIVIVKDGALVWDDALYEDLQKYVLQSAKAQNVPMVWGGTFTERDMDHFELDQSTYGTGVQT